MDREKLQSFITNAESDLASVRSSLLIVAQTADASDLTVPRRNLTRLREEAVLIELTEIARSAADCIDAIDNLACAPTSVAAKTYAALDLVARIEAAVWKIPLSSTEFLDDVSGFVDASFSELVPKADDADPTSWADEDYDVDEETLDVFRAEADELLGNISQSLETLAKDPTDQKALWEIRRNAHTFKGAAGIVGLSDASSLAHRMEDLLDKIVELRLDASSGVIDFLTASTKRLASIAASKETDETVDLDAEYRSAIATLSRTDDASRPRADGQTRLSVSANSRKDDYKPVQAPIVRVSLDRLDDLLKVSGNLLINRSALAERFTELGLDTSLNSETLQKLASIFDAQKCLTDELHSKLLRIRMVKFGMLETRLSRAVHVTCLDENKKAGVEIENGDVEIDTQIIDALIEPLLHLLKNAVVHGIEPPETRRLIGKPAIGMIRIRVDADEEAVVLSVSDDGCGISIPKLKDRAIANGLIDAETARSLDDRAAMKLIFDRGLTTADKLDLNAGRGVGMSIVKESVESRGGSVLVESEPQRGTTFTVLVPLGFVKNDVETPSSETDATESLAPLVLIVDDSASIRRQTAKLVENAGLRSITANNGADALELLLNGSTEPDLILSDVEMPQIDGWELLEYIKTDDNFGQIPVVIVTSLDSDEHRTRANELGASDYIVKPFSERDLELILEKFGGSVNAS